MTRQDAIRSVESGILIVEELADSMDVFGVGDMGIANTTPSAAIAAAATGTPVADVTGRGTGVNDSQFEQKMAVIRRALEINRPNPKDGLDLLAKVGGYEIGGIAGAILGSAIERKPVVIDGFITAAGALIACLLSPASADYMIAAHRSVENGHKIMLKRLGKEPLLDLSLRLGEGTGAAWP